MESTSAPRGTYIQRGTRHLTDPRPPLQWMEMSFTADGFTLLKAYRSRLSCKEGRPVPLGRVLDLLIKSHPFALGLQEAQQPVQP